MVHQKNAAPAPKSLSTAEILALLGAGKIKAEEAAKLIDANTKQPGQLHCKVSEKGAVSVYGLQRMPVTLYAQQWERLDGFMPQLREFIEANKASLSYK